MRSLRDAICTELYEIGYRRGMTVDECGEQADAVLAMPEIEWAVRIASSELLFTNPRPPASACPPEVRAQITGVET